MSAELEKRSTLGKKIDDEVRKMHDMFSEHFASHEIALEVVEELVREPALVDIVIPPAILALAIEGATALVEELEKGEGQGISGTSGRAGQ